MEGRLLTCTECGTTIRVYELPGPFIDPGRYVGSACGCLTAAGEDEAGSDGQLSLVAPGVLEETRDYDPWIAAIPF